MDKSHIMSAHVMPTPSNKEYDKYGMSIKSFQGKNSPRMDLSPVNEPEVNYGGLHGSFKN